MMKPPVPQNLHLAPSNVRKVHMDVFNKNENGKDEDLGYDTIKGVKYSTLQYSTVRYSAVQ